MSENNPYKKSDKENLTQLKQRLTQKSLFSKRCSLYLEYDIKFNNMKAPIHIISYLSILFFVTSCGGSNTPKDYSKEVDEGSFKDTTFTSEALGWSMNFPANWTITKKSSLEQLDERSKEISNDDSNTAGIKRTLAFQKNYNNNFQSTWETFDGSETDYKTYLKNTHTSIYNNYLDQRITMDTMSEQLTIDKQTFDGFQVKLFDRTGKNYGTQLLYSALRNGKLMNVTIAFDNETDRGRILDLFKHSTFK